VADGAKEVPVTPALTRIPKRGRNSRFGAVNLNALLAEQQIGAVPYTIFVPWRAWRYHRTLPMGHSTLTRLLQLLFAIALLFPPRSAAAEPQVDWQYGPLPVFELHSGFWINLHHTLYGQARQSRDGRGSPSGAGAATRRTPSEQLAWDAAVSYYAANYQDKDLLFNTELILLKNQLGDFEQCDELSGAKKKTCDAGLSPKLTRILNDAAPVYRAHEWPEHDRANRKWIAGVSPLVRVKGVELSQRLAEIYQTRWPKERIRVDVTAFANYAGAYTTLDPLRVVISSTDPRNQGNSALEVLFHEASNGIAEPVQLAINRECRQRDKAIPRDLWHALVFYTTGEIIKPVVNAENTSVGEGEYTPYAFRERLYQRGWDEYLKLLERFWQPYLDGKTTFDDAIAHIVSAL
jgi:hypothetical protein